jgi:hypothetical protein
VTEQSFAAVWGAALLITSRSLVMEGWILLVALLGALWLMLRD